MYEIIELVNWRPVGKVIAAGDKDYVMQFYVCGKNALVWSDETPLKRLSAETLLKRRTSRAKNKLMKKAPLFFDEFFKRELAAIALMPPVRINNDELEQPKFDS